MRRFRTFSSFRVSLILLLSIACSMGLAAQRVSASADITTVAEQYLLSAANQERAVRGLGPLHRNALLARAATLHAQEMAAHRSISHQFAGEPELTARGASAGVAFSVISENVGEAPSVVTIHDMWMHSEHHRANLLEPSVDSVGISVINRGGELFAVEDFAKTVRAASVAEQESAIGSLVARNGLDVVDSSDLTTAARETCRMETGYAGPRKPYFVMRFTTDSLTQLPEQLKTRLASERYHQAAVGACYVRNSSPFTSYSFAVLLYP